MLKPWLVPSRQTSPPGRLTGRALAEALEKGELVLHYQPRVSLRDGKINGFEALLRWNHPRRGLLEPRIFLPLAQQTPLAVPLGNWVLEQACRQLASWPLQPGMTMAVNTSLPYLLQPSLPANIAATLAGFGLDPRCLRLEIAERSIMAAGPAIAGTLRHLRAGRIGLAIDNFGTGHRFCHYLRELPFDTLKIDESFVRQLGGANDSGAIIGTILRMARSLNIEVTAEAVESRHQFHVLATMGCAHGQGYYFSAPVDARHAERLIREQSARLV